MAEENKALKQIIADQKIRLEEIIKEKEVSAKQDAKDLSENIVKVEKINKEQDVKMQELTILKHLLGHIQKFLKPY